MYVNLLTSVWLCVYVLLGFYFFIPISLYFSCVCVGAYIRYWKTHIHQFRQICLCTIVFAFLCIRVFIVMSAHVCCIIVCVCEAEPEPTDAYISMCMNYIYRMSMWGGVNGVNSLQINISREMDVLLCCQVANREQWKQHLISCSKRRWRGGAEDRCKTIHFGKGFCYCCQKTLSDHSHCKTKSVWCAMWWWRFSDQPNWLKSPVWTYVGLCDPTDLLKKTEHNPY